MENKLTMLELAVARHIRLLAEQSCNSWLANNFAKKKKIVHVCFIKTVDAQ